MTHAKQRHSKGLSPAWRRRIYFLAGSKVNALRSTSRSSAPMSHTFSMSEECRGSRAS